MNLINKKLVQTAKKQLITVDGSMAFWIHNGPVLRNLVDLRDAFGSMSAELFNYHANSEKNDFANWVEHVLKEPILAAKLRSYKTQKTMAKAVGTYIKKFYTV
jgi:hypothetical protein